MKKALTVVCSLAALALAACSGSEQPSPPQLPPGPGPTGSGSNDQTDTNGLQGQAGQTGDNGDTNNEGQAGTTGVMGQPSTSMTGDDGAMGQPSTSMEGTGSEIAVGEGNALVPNADFWVAGGTNAAGIQGAFYELSDAADGGTGETVIDSFTVDETTGAVCISGTASEVPDENSYNTHWGGGIGLGLGDLGAMMGEVPWNRGEFTTFNYTLSGPDIPESLRFQVDFEGKGDATFCQPIGGTAGTRSSALNATVGADGPVMSCWDAALAAPVPAAAGFLSIQWQVATAVGAPTTFDFCVENLSVQ